MSIRKKGEKWKVDLRPNGTRGKRIIREFATRREAARFEKWALGESSKKPWEPKNDKRSLSEICDLWYEAKGIHLKSGEKVKSTIKEFDAWLGNNAAIEVNPQIWRKYSSFKKSGGASPKTLNNILGYVRSVLNWAERTGEIKWDHKLKSVEPIKLVERELSWLTLEQIEDLFKAFESAKNPHVKLLAEVSLSTGCRWGEAEKIRLRDVRNQKITFNDTKSKRNRAVPISGELEQMLIKHLRTHDKFSRSIQALSHAIKRAGIELPRGQAAHSLRHTFASHFMQEGGNILALQRILGHSTIVMTMRYAHLAPDHLIDAVRLNPLRRVRNSKLEDEPEFKELIAKAKRNHGN